jgi:4'-phosphopantetheinyl transferase
VSADLRYLVQHRRDVPDGLDWLGDAEAEVLAALARPARRASWLLGRWTGKRAVLALLEAAGGGVRLAEIEILAAPGGAPEVTVGGARAPFSISLSHREDEAVALLGPASARVGVDVERVEPRSADLVADFFAPEEQCAWERAPAEARDALACLVWSAKESALKVLGEGLRRDTRSVVVAIGEAIDAAGWGTLRVRLEEGGEIEGFHRRDGARLITAAASVPARPPRFITMGGPLG